MGLEQWLSCKETEKSKEAPQAGDPLNRGEQKHEMQIDMIYLRDSDTEVQISAN